MQSSPLEQGFALPDNLDPPDNVYFCIPIPNDPGYIKAFIGVMYDLSIWVSWQRDADHKGAAAARKMKLVYDALTSGALDGCNMFDVRLNDCRLQKTVDGGTTWIDVGDLPACIRAGAEEVLHDEFPPDNPGGRDQPGPQPGGSAPAPGQCFDLVMSLNAGSKLLIPIAVGPNWTIELISYKGATTDGRGEIFDVWKCGNGAGYTLGECTGLSTHDANDPLPAEPHESIILFLPDGTYVPIVETGPFTVPATMPTGNFQLQLNDNTVTFPPPSPSGSLSVHIRLCNSEIWCHDFDFLTTNGGWVSSPADGSGWGATYTAGVGWHGAGLALAMKYGMGDTHITEVYLESPNLGPFGQFNIKLASAEGGGPLSGMQAVPMVSGVAFPVNWSVPASCIMMIQDNAGGDVTITRVRVKGTGTNPFGTSNC
jgi:hypothetical protein